MRRARAAASRVPSRKLTLISGKRWSARVEWRGVRKLPRLAYGHNALAEYALARLQAKIGYSNIAYGLLPAEFTLAELHEVYEAILGRKLDRRNFRKRVLQLDLVHPLRKERRGPHRPATLYAFRRRRPMMSDIL